MIWFDHVTMFVHDRHEQAARLRDAGMNAVEGGLHAGFGSANDLCYFDLFYLELLEVTDAVEAANSGSEVCRYATEFLDTGAGLATLALETDDLAGVVDRLRGAGYTVPEPIRMQRVHDDGFVSHSTIAYPTKHAAPIRPPIVIERSTGPQKRRHELEERATIAPHPCGELQVPYVAVAVEDALASASVIAEAYGVVASSTLRPLASLGGEYADVMFDRALLRFVQPTSPGIVRQRLDARGAGPVAVGLLADETARQNLGGTDQPTLVDIAGIPVVLEPLEQYA